MKVVYQRRSNTTGLAIQMLIFSILASQCAKASPESPFLPEKVGFSVQFKDEESPYRITGVFVLPGETLHIKAVDDDEKSHYVMKSSAGKASHMKTNEWQWQAPQETGCYPVTIVCYQSADDSITLNMFVMVPYDRLRGGYLNGYRIGKYPAIPLEQLSIYKPPRGFIEVTEENQETLVSPHFKLKQFLCKQESCFPKYVVLRERLLLKLELILEKVNEMGFRCDTFSVMSGYRTPYYNRAIGNVRYSRHLWGGAADIFIDEDPHDDMMDDLNQDGTIDNGDAAILYDIIDDMYGKPWYGIFVGGLARYEKTSCRGPFVHVDVRGFRARWGY